MRVAGEQDKRMLQDEGCDPHGVLWDGGALLHQLAIKGCVMVRRLFIGVEHSHAGLQQKPAQDSLVARSLAARGKSRAQCSEHDEWQPDFVGKLDRLTTDALPRHKSM